MANRSWLSGKLTARWAACAAHHGHFGDGGGLYLQVSGTGTKSWCFRFTFGGRRREMGLGQFPTISLADARLAASDCRRALNGGLDPIEERLKIKSNAKLAAARTVTFRECAQRYIATNRTKWRNEKHSKQWASTLERYAYPVFGNMPVSAIDQEMILQALEPIWNAKAETASRLRGRIEIVLSWATARGYKEGLNPARWRGHLDQILPAKLRIRRVKHHRSLSHKEIAAFVKDLRQQEGVGALALEFTILTAGRTNEVLGARWDEISFATKVWSVPAERMFRAKA
jgi:hypothetical protein